MTTCCNLVGNFPIHVPGLISITSQGTSEVTLITSGSKNAAIVAPSTGTISLSAYADTARYYGCPGRAGVSIPWVIRNNCNEFFYLYGGAGKSYISGEVGAYASFPKITGVTNPLNSYAVLNASASSGPTSLYENSIQQDGYGLIYKGQPWNIDTTTEAGCKVNLTSLGIGTYGECRLQSLNIQCNPGQIPVVNLSYIYSI